MTHNLIIGGLVAVMSLVSLNPLIAMAQSALQIEGQPYTVQADDQLPRLAEKYFSDLTAIDTIVAATNLKAADDDRYTVIEDHDQLTVGQQLFIPDDRQAFDLASAFGPSPAQQQLLANLEVLGRPPELHNEVWLNSDPLKLAGLQGQVVIVEFWTYG